MAQKTKGKKQNPLALMKTYTEKLQIKRAKRKETILSLCEEEKAIFGL